MKPKSLLGMVRLPRGISASITFLPVSEEDDEEDEEEAEEEERGGKEGANVRERYK